MWTRKRIVLASNDPTTSADDHTISGKRLPLYAFATVVGTALEYYDFDASAIAAGLVWASLYFPEHNAAISLLLAFTTYGVGYLSRPFGSVIFGHFGDRWGRRGMLFWSLFTMGIGTLAIGLLPGYAAWGVTAAALLVIFRMLQGLGVGGEAGNVNSWIIENAAKSKHRAFWTSWVAQGSPIGVLAATGLFAYLAGIYSHTYFITEGWRIVYYIGFVIAIVGALIRYGVAESPLFEQVRTKQQTVKFPIGLVFRKYWRRVIIMVLAALFIFVNFGATSFAVSIAKVYLGKTASFASLTKFWPSLATIFLIIPIAFLGDKIGRKKVVLAATGLLTIFAYPYWLMFSSGNDGMMILANTIVVVLASGAGFNMVVSVFPESFPTEVRASGNGVSYQIAGAIGGFSGPVILSSILAYYGWGVNAYSVMAVFMAIISFVSFLAFLGLKETKDVDLSQVT